MSTSPTPNPDKETNPAPASREEISDVQQFLYREARMLDERRFEEWFGLLANEIRYWMPTRVTRLREKEGEDWDPEKELSGPDELAFMDDNKITLLVRVKRAQRPQSWSEDPPSRTRRIVSNVEVERCENPGEYLVHSCFVLHRTRDQEQHQLIGQRRDRLRREGDSFLIVERRIALDTTVLPSPNLSVFF